KQTLIACVVALFYTTSSQAQTATITGSVKDKSTQETLIGVNILLEDTDPTIGTVTDPQGKFKLSAVPGSYNITATFVGYKAQTRFNVLLTSGNVNTINF